MRVNEVKIRSSWGAVFASPLAKYGIVAVLAASWLLAITACALCETGMRLASGNSVFANAFNDVLRAVSTSENLETILEKLSQLGTVLAAAALLAPLGVMALSAFLAQKVHRRTTD